jgi:hypothetical protein
MYLLVEMMEDDNCVAAFYGSRQKNLFTFGVDVPDGSSRAYECGDNLKSKGKWR